jgi:hypothetical protein
VYHEEALEVYRFGVSNSLKCGDHGLGAGDEDRQHVLDALSQEERLAVVLRAVMRSGPRRWAMWGSFS